MTDHLVEVRDAHLHNLKHVNVDFPRGKVVAFTGVSGSGKSSLAFGTIHGESQRRYLESVAPFARRLIGSAVDPQVEAVNGMPPTVALEQRTSAGGARSTVGTLTALSNSVRLLFSRVGDHPDDLLLYSNSFSPNTSEGQCPTCHGAGFLMAVTEESVVPDPSLSIMDGAIAAWPGAWQGKNFRDILATLGIDVFAPWQNLPQETRDWILFTEETPIVTVVPERSPTQTQRTYQGQWRSVERYLKQTAANSKAEVSRKRALTYMATTTCPTCDGHRLTPEALRVTYLGLHIYELTALTLADLLALLEQRASAGRAAENASRSLTAKEEAERILLPTILPVLRAVVGLGLGHLSMERPARSLSTGELQRLRLAALLRSGLFGVAYVLDEPSAGLHPSEKGMLRDLFAEFVDQGNSVLIVEHDMSLVAEADWVVDVGPLAGENGGEILFSGPTTELAAVENSQTARFVEIQHITPTSPADARPARGTLTVTGISGRNLEDVEVAIPLGTLTAITGTSGSGKSTILTDVLGEQLSQRVRTTVADEPDADEDAPEQDGVTVRSVTGADGVDRLVHITQKPIGRTPRSCLATYTSLFDRVRQLFAGTEEAKQRGWGVGRFSFNSAQGRCPECSGMGQIEVELIFLPGSYTTCPLCHGTRYHPDTLEVTWRGASIADVLGMTVSEALTFFADEPRVERALRALDAIGLGYLRLGQSATELSGGEAQRIKLATELQRAARGHTVYLMDEPTTGLHPADADLLVQELNRLVDQGGTVVIVEHDMRVVAGADHVIDLHDGHVVAAGTPSEIVAAGTATGQFLT